MDQIITMKGKNHFIRMDKTRQTIKKIIGDRKRTNCINKALYYGMKYYVLISKRTKMKLEGHVLILYHNTIQIKLNT